jgi:hypothetical protein
MKRQAFFYGPQRKSTLANSYPFHLGQLDLEIIVGFLISFPLLRMLPETNNSGTKESMGSHITGLAFLNKSEKRFNASPTSAVQEV